MKTMVSTAGIPDPVRVADVLAAGEKAGPWVVERELGRGGMGAVYAVVHEEIGKRAALKVVHPRLLGPGFNCDRMLLEAKVVNQVGHPNIVDIFETGKLADGRPYIVMERLEGLALSARADQTKVLPDQVIAILLQICDALIAAHAAGVVHRDLKLDNVFLVDNPEDPATPKVKLLDWGIAKVMSHDVRHTVEGQLVGTPQYLSPEQARGLDVTEKTDVYSLGVMAYELFLEQLPFEAETAAEVMAMHLRLAPPLPSELWPDVPPALQDLLLEMLAKTAEQRPTMLEVARRLDAVRGELQKRCHARQTKRHRSATPVDASEPGRAAGLAATQAAWRLPSRRWQYALGASMLAASTLLFCVGRGGDRTADAATISAHATLESSAPGTPGALARAALAAQAARPDVAAVTAELRPDVAGVTAQTAELPAPVRVELASAGSAPRPAPARPSPSLRSSASRQVAPPSTPVVPRRGAKVDPDGTFVAY
jgi:tRNA A-37 threonylcarbamoyl transferase component Bud32